MQDIDLLAIKPFEICSIRPPTENYSLTFRLTRNCYWNKCRFCPVYKLGARFSKRTLDEVKEDIERAKKIDDLLIEWNIIDPYFFNRSDSRFMDLINEIKEAHREAGFADSDAREKQPEISEEIDPRMAWFLSWFRDKPAIEDSLNHVLTWRTGGARTCFFGDGDSLILKPDFFAEVTGHVKKNFPSLERFTVYGRTKSAAKLRTLSELQDFKKAGLDRVHFGLESGSDRVLSLMNKGVTKQEHIEGCLRTKEAGLSCSVYIMPGLGGRDLSEEHAYETADALSRIAPDFVRLRTLEVFPQTPLEDLIKTGEFTEASEEQVVKEIKILIENITSSTEILSDSASNLLNVNGYLPVERNDILQEIDEYLDLSQREKLEFSFNARMNSFTGQYGSFSEDIIHSITPFIVKGRINLSYASDEMLEKTIRLIRSKLMP